MQDLTVNKNFVSIVFQKEDLIVVDKPAGISIHSSQHDQDTHFLLQMVRKHARKRVYAVHRLDKGTSGIILFTSDKTKVSLYQKALEAGSSKKIYRCLVHGNLPAQGLISRPLKNKQKKKLQDSLTFYKRIKYFPELHSSLVEVVLGTGRSHQIRRHLRSAGHPLQGDREYGWKTQSSLEAKKAGLNRMFLHSYRLELSLPNNENPLVFTCELPLELDQLVDT